MRYFCRTKNNDRAMMTEIDRDRENPYAIELQQWDDHMQKYTKQVFTGITTSAEFKNIWSGLVQDAIGKQVKGFGKGTKDIDIFDGDSDMSVCTTLLPQHPTTPLPHRASPTKVPPDASAHPPSQTLTQQTRQALATTPTAATASLHLTPAPTTSLRQTTMSTALWAGWVVP